MRKNKKVNGCIVEYSQQGEDTMYTGLVMKSELYFWIPPESWLVLNIYTKYTIYLNNVIFLQSYSLPIKKFTP